MYSSTAADSAVWNLYPKYRIYTKFSIDSIQLLESRLQFYSCIVYTAVLDLMYYAYYVTSNTTKVVHWW
jgi:hypothetical protein